MTGQAPAIRNTMPAMKLMPPTAHITMMNPFRPSDRCGVIVAENRGDSGIESLPDVMATNIGEKWPEKRPGKD